MKNRFFLQISLCGRPISLLNKHLLLLVALSSLTTLWLGVGLCSLEECDKDKEVVYVDFCNSDASAKPLTKIMSKPDINYKKRHKKVGLFQKLKRLVLRDPCSFITTLLAVPAGTGIYFGTKAIINTIKEQHDNDTDMSPVFFDTSPDLNTHGAFFPEQTDESLSLSSEMITQHYGPWSTPLPEAQTRVPMGVRNLSTTVSTDEIARLSPAGIRESDGREIMNTDPGITPVANKSMFTNATGDSGEKVVVTENVTTPESLSLSGTVTDLAAGNALSPARVAALSNVFPDPFYSTTAATETTTALPDNKDGEAWAVALGITGGIAIAGVAGHKAKKHLKLVCGDGSVNFRHPGFCGLGVVLEGPEGVEEYRHYGVRRRYPDQPVRTGEQQSLLPPPVSNDKPPPLPPRNRAVKSNVSADSVYAGDKLTILSSSTNRDGTRQVIISYQGTSYEVNERVATAVSRADGFATTSVRYEYESNTIVLKRYRPLWHNDSPYMTMRYQDGRLISSGDGNTRYLSVMRRPDGKIIRDSKLYLDLSGGSRFEEITYLDYFQVPDPDQAVYETIKQPENKVADKKNDQVVSDTAVDSDSHKLNQASGGESPKDKNRGAFGNKDTDGGIKVSHGADRHGSKEAVYSEIGPPGDSRSTGEKQNQIEVKVDVHRSADEDVKVNSDQAVSDTAVDSDSHKRHQASGGARRKDKNRGPFGNKDADGGSKVNHGANKHGYKEVAYRSTDEDLKINSDDVKMHDTKSVSDGHSQSGGPADGEAGSRHQGPPRDLNLNSASPPDKSMKVVSVNEGGGSVVVRFKGRNYQVHGKRPTTPVGSIYKASGRVTLSIQGDSVRAATTRFLDIAGLADQYAVGLPAPHYPELPAVHEPGGTISMDTRHDAQGRVTEQLTRRGNPHRFADTYEITTFEYTPIGTDNQRGAVGGAASADPTKKTGDNSHKRCKRSIGFACNKQKPVQPDPLDKRIDKIRRASDKEILKKIGESDFSIDIKNVRKGVFSTSNRPKNSFDTLPRKLKAKLPVIRMRLLPVITFFLVDYAADIILLAIDLAKDIPRWQTQDPITAEVMSQSDFMKYGSYGLPFLSIQNMILDHDSEMEGGKHMISKFIAEIRSENHQMYSQLLPDADTDAIRFLPDMIFSETNFTERFAYADGSVIYKVPENRPLPDAPENLSPFERAMLGYQENSDRRYFFFITKIESDGSERLIRSGSGMSILMTHLEAYQHFLDRHSDRMQVMMTIYFRHILRPIDIEAETSRRYQDHIRTHFAQPVFNNPMMPGMFTNIVTPLQTKEGIRNKVKLEVEARTKASKEFLGETFRLLSRYLEPTYVKYYRIFNYLSELSEEVPGYHDYQQRMGDIQNAEASECLRSQMDKKAQDSRDSGKQPAEVTDNCPPPSADSFTDIPSVTKRIMNRRMKEREKIPLTGSREQQRNKRLIQVSMDDSLAAFNTLRRNQPQAWRIRQTHNDYLDIMFDDKKESEHSGRDLIAGSQVIPGEWQNRRVADGRQEAPGEQSDIPSVSEESSGSVLFSQSKEVADAFIAQGKEKSSQQSDLAGNLRADEIPVSYRLVHGQNGHVQLLEASTNYCVAKTLWPAPHSQSDEKQCPGIDPSLKSIPEQEKTALFEAVFNSDILPLPNIILNKQQSSPSLLTSVEADCFTTVEGRIVPELSALFFQNSNGLLHRYQFVDDSSPRVTMDGTAFSWSGRQLPTLYRRIETGLSETLTPVSAGCTVVGDKTRIDHRKIVLPAIFFERYGVRLTFDPNDRHQQKTFKLFYVTGSGRRVIGGRIGEFSATREEIIAKHKVISLDCELPDVDRIKLRISWKVPLGNGKSAYRQNHELYDDEWEHAYQGIKLVGNLSPGNYRLSDDVVNTDFLISPDDWSRDNPHLPAAQQLLELPRRMEMLKVASGTDKRYTDYWQELLFGQPVSGESLKGDTQSIKVVTYKCVDLPSGGLGYIPYTQLDIQNAIAVYHENIWQMIAWCGTREDITLTKDDIRYLLTKGVGTGSMEGFFRGYVREKYGDPEAHDENRPEGIRERRAAPAEYERSSASRPSQAASVGVISGSVALNAAVSSGLLSPGKGVQQSSNKATNVSDELNNNKSIFKDGNINHKAGLSEVITPEFLCQWLLINQQLSEGELSPGMSAQLEAIASSSRLGLTKWVTVFELLDQISELPVFQLFEYVQRNASVMVEEYHTSRQYKENKPYRRYDQPVAPYAEFSVILKNKEHPVTALLLKAQEDIPDTEAMCDGDESDDNIQHVTVGDLLKEAVWLGQALSYKIQAPSNYYLMSIMTDLGAGLSVKKDKQGAIQFKRLFARGSPCFQHIRAFKDAGILSRKVLVSMTVAHFFHNEVVKHLLNQYGKKSHINPFCYSGDYILSALVPVMPNDKTTVEDMGHRRCLKQALNDLISDNGLLKNNIEGLTLGSEVSSLQDLVFQGGINSHGQRICPMIPAVFFQGQSHTVIFDKKLPDKISETKPAHLYLKMNKAAPDYLRGYLFGESSASLLLRGKRIVKQYLSDLITYEGQ